MARKRQHPGLTVAIVPDFQAFGDAIHGFLKVDPRRSVVSKAIRRAQALLHRHLDDRAWSIYLEFEEMVTARHDEQLRLVAKWAFEKGRRHRR